MKRKRSNNKGKRGAHNASRNNSSRKAGKKTNKSGDAGRTSPPAQLQNHPEDSAVVSSNQNEPQADQEHLSTTMPRSVKAEAQTQTEKLKMKNKLTQTDPVKHTSRHTQVETDAMSEAALPGEERSGNVSHEKKEEKSAEDSMDVSAPDPGGGQKKDMTTLSDSGGEKEVKNEMPGQSGELQNSSDTKSTDRGEKAKSYAEAASGCEHKKDSKEQSNQATARQEEGKGAQRKPPERGPPEKPMFTFYVNMVLDRSFKFNRETDKILLCHADGFIEMEITHFMDLHKDGYLIEANFLVEEHLVQRGSVMSYKYAVQHHRNVINEIVTRTLRFPFEFSIKEMHLFEPHVTRSGPGFFRSFMRSADDIISKAWHNSARVLLDRLFKNWDPSNQECVRNFTQLLNHYQRDFLRAGERVVYTNDLLTPTVNVNELIAKKLVNILKRELGGSPSESSVDISPVTFGLSVFQVCRGCGIELGIKDWALLCQHVSSDSALRQMGEMKNTFPSLEYTVIGLMNQCARLLLSELVLLVPLLYSVRQLSADSSRLGPTVEEPNWTGLQLVEYRAFRERIRTHSEKRSMMIKLVQDHKTLAEGKPHILTSWLSMMAFEDINQFAELTKIDPERLIQSQMYRMKDFEMCPSTDFRRSQNILEVSEGVLRYLLKCVEQDKDRIMALELVWSVFQCCRSLHKSTCKIARLTSVFKAPVLSFQLVLKMAEIQNQALSKDEKENESKRKELLTQLEIVQKEFSEWRNGLFQKPLFGNSRLGYPNEIELWDALFGLDCSMQCVTDQWTRSVERDLRKRISALSDEQKVQICCVETSAMAIKKSHNTIQMCFQNLCQSAIKNICQAGKERSLLQSLLSSLKSLDPSILSSIILESAARFENDPVTQLLDAQSAIHVLLSQGHWNLKINEDASQVMNMCQSTLCTLVNSLCQGDIPFGHVETILKHRKHFPELFKQCKKNCKLENISIDVEGLLNQRAKDVQALLQQRAHMEVLIKMIGKISEVIHVPDISFLEEENKLNLQSVSLNALVQTQPCFCKEHLKEISTGQVLYCSADFTVLNTAREMYEFQDSNLILKSWMDRAAELAPNESVSLDLQEVISEIWQPSVDDFKQLGVKIAHGIVTFEEVDRAVVGCGDEGDGTHVKKELNLMVTMLGSYSGLEKNWPEERLSQIQEYRQLHHAAVASGAILTIRDKLKLQGDFSQISSLTQLKEASFKKKTLGSLSNDLISAKQKLLIVNHQHTACLEAFLKSETLVKWVKNSITNLSELKVFMDLASISAGENDIEIDRLASFGDAVVGYSPLLFFLRKTAGFDELLACAQQVWDKLKGDEKLPEKLEHSFRFLDWLKGLRETHGSVEKSSLSLVSAINTSGVYHIGWPVGSTGKKCLGNVVHLKVTNHEKDKNYSLDELVELQNKLMLMSSKGQHGIDQVNKFTEIFEGVQRMGRVLMQLCSSGNIFFREMEAHVKCNPGKDPCINIHFPLLKKDVAYHGRVAEGLQEVCRSMEACHKDWCNFMTEVRSRYYALNHYTSEQAVYLGFWIKNICEKGRPVPQQIWHLLTALKPDATIYDIRSAYEKANKSSEHHHLSVPVQEELREDTDEDEMSVEGNSEELEAFSDDQEYNMEEALETLEGLWEHYRNDMPRYLLQYTDIETLAEFLSSLSAMNELPIRRRLPSTLQEGKPNLVLCPAAELIMTTLSFYMESREQAFPSVDEVLMCHEDTTEEEVEIFLRRCLGQGSPSSHQKIYTLFNPGLLTYDVSVALVEHFEAMEKSAGSHYRLVLVCPVNQDRYVPSFFSNYKVQAGLTVSAERAKEYLQFHLTVDSSDFPGGLSAWLITSKRPAVGKSLCVTRMFQSFQTEFPEEAHYLPVRLIEPCVVIDSFIQILDKKLSQQREQDPVLLHIDTAAVQKGLDEFLFKLLVLGCLSNSEGKLWRRNSAQLIAIEALLLENRQAQKESNQGLLNLLPTIHCRSPKEVKELELRNRNQIARHAFLDPLMDRQEFGSEGIQRPYQYLKRFNRNENLDHFKYQAQSVEGDAVDCLHHLLSNCGLNDPSWAELKHFTWFLNLQLKDCESSGFCDPNFFGDSLRGFKNFIVKFMIHMARDFASPSLDLSDQSSSPLQMSDREDDLLARLTIRKRWETESHPYIFFNADHLTMTFLGFHVVQSLNRRTLNAVDPRTNRVLMGDVMSPDLFSGLQDQRISFSEDFDQLPRETKLKKLSFVIGTKIRERFDPDPTYELTADNVMKMLAIHMRFRCEIPVILMGETGCGKTRLVKFLCDLQREGTHVENMKLVKVHGGTTAETIYKKVKEAERLALKNRREHKLDTILFFDEANTTEAIFAIKEVLCDKTVQGLPLQKNSGLKIIAACNPYRRHTTRMIERLERAGLGYRVKAGETEDRLGKVPMRQLVYRVHPLPPSMMPLVWDFGQLSDSAELSYIQLIVKKQMKQHCLPPECQSIITNVLAASQRYMRSQVDECSFVSLRDVERSMRVLLWFYQHRDHLFPNAQLSVVRTTLTCLALAVGVCYYPSLEHREAYLKGISKYFPHPLNSKEALEHEVSSCQDFFLKNIKTRETIAKNLALKENVFLMVVCIELRIPLFLVGKPGSSKSLAKTVVVDAMQRQTSDSELFKKLKEVHMVSFQCSPHSSPEGIVSTFRNCARFQKDKNLDEYVSVVVLDEIGLAEDSPQMPLKTLHPLLEDGCIDNENPDPHMKVGFVGISNWALDPAKMNRGIFVSRCDPTEHELVETAKGICSSSEAVLNKIKHLLPKLAEGFLRICKSDKDQFFGLRDYYSLVKMIFNVVKHTSTEPTESDLAEAILRNFSGQKDNFDPLCYFNNLIRGEVPRISTLKMIKVNLDHHNKEECRYLLLLTTNNAALYIIQQSIFSNGSYTRPEIVFGSGFPKDQEYAQICRNVSRVKACMETGRTVILLNLLNLYESLYDALNQYYVSLCGQQYVDLGLGSHRVKCRVHKKFRLIVIEDQDKVYEKFPVPLKNRLEKHRVDRSTDLTAWQHRVLEKLRNWVREFAKHSQSSASAFSPSDAFVGFHGDACASALLQALERREKQDHQRVGDGSGDAVKSMEEDISCTKPTELDSIAEFTEDNRNENEEQVHTEGEGIQPNEEGPVADSEVQSSTHKIPIDENAGELLLVQVGGNEEDTEAKIGQNPNAVNQGDVEKESYSEPNEDEEQEVYEFAKSFLLNCATPDSVLRLKYSELGKPEISSLQRLYFHQQGHHSLRDFMDSHLKKPDRKKTRFIEVTTFSSLLTKADVRILSQALGLPMESLLLLSLHQFDTETSFCTKIRCFLQNAHLSQNILLVQMDMEESLCKNELIASAKYCTMNELLAVGSEDCSCYIVFITKLSRIASGNKYIGFQGGSWLSVHIDDLRDTDDMSLDLSVLCGMPISKLLSKTAQPVAMDIEDEGPQWEQSAYLHSLSLLRSCTQKAVSLLRDPVNKASRSMERVHTLLGLLENDPGHTGARFQEVLLSRLMTVLTQREDLIHQPEEWVNREAMKREALQEGGTLRHTLWRYLQSVLTPVLARIIEVLDRDSNMDLLYSAGLSEELVQFWLDIFNDGQLLDLAVPQSSNASEQEIDVQCNLVVGEELRPCAVPFSWLIKLYCNNLWEESQFMQGIELNSQERIQQFVSAVTSSGLGSYIGKLSEPERVQLGQKYLTDFVILTFKVKTEEEVMVFSAAVLDCVAALQQVIGVPSDLSPAWIMAAAQRFSPRLDTLSHALQLQPQVAPMILKQDFQKDPPDMYGDILALGICVEETKLQPITSLSECLSFLRRVEMLQPCLQRAYSNTYSSLCSPGCLKQLDEIKLVWQGLLVVAAFIEQVVVKMNSPDERLRALTLKYCSQLQKLMGECNDLQSRASLQQLIRILNEYHEESISRALRFGVKCPVCLEDLTKPCMLQCEHVLCLRCIQRCIQQGTKCPKCRAELPPNYQPAVSASIESALRQHRQLRTCCNSFFLEVVSRFCFTTGQRPQEDMVELLFSLLISAQGDVYKTRDLTPFLECVDQSPVVRSVLPKLLLQYSSDQVRSHIQTYFQNLEGHILVSEDRAELYRLFVNCFQDSLLCVRMSETLETKELQQCQQEDTNFLSRLARRQTPSREQQPAEFLLSMARFRMCLDSAANILPRAIGQKSGGFSELEQKFLEQVKAVCEYSRNDWSRIYLLRALYRQAGTDGVEAVMNSTTYEWVFPSELLRLQRLIPVEVDRFLCCGEQYKILRNGVGQVLLDSSTGSLKAALQNGHSSVKSVLLALALFRQVTCRLSSPDTAMRPGAQELTILEGIVRESTKGHLRELCASLLSNSADGLMSHLHVSSSSKRSGNDRRFQELLVHAVAVFHSGNKLLFPLHLIATRPQTMKDTFLPTMPDDHTSEVTRWLNKEGKLTTYYCLNGHLSLVGECGKPMVQAKCDTCGVPIGGVQHKAVDGFVQAHGGLSDKTRTGHILDAAARRSEAPNRNLPMAQSCVLRLFLHLAMLHGSALNLQGVREMIHPNVNRVHDFLMQHLEKDMECLGKSLNLNWDDTAITIHLILNALAELSTDLRSVQWSSRQEREQWEKEVCKRVIDPILKNLNRHLTDAQAKVTADDAMSSSALMKVLVGDPRTLLALPSECPSHHVIFWTPPDPLTIERLSQLITQNQERRRVPLLALFLENVQFIRHLACLPDLAALLSDLMRVVHPDSETSIASLLHGVPAGHQKNTLTERLKTFFRVWNHLRMELVNNPAVSPELYEKDITMESSVQYLSLSRHGPGSCLYALINLLSDTHNSLVREARKLSRQEDSDYSVPVGVLSKNQLALCHPEKELLPLVLAHCHYTLVKGQQTASDYDLQAIEKQLHRRFVAGKPRIQTDTEKYLKRHHQDFSEVLKDVRTKIPQEPLKGSVCSSIRTVLRSFTDVCDAVHALEIGLRFLGKTGGRPKSALLSYLQKSLRMERNISSNVAKALAESRLDQCTATWQLLTCWRSELKLRRGQDPFPKLSKEFREELSSEERKEVKEFLDVTDVELFILELHEILLLKTDSSSLNSYSSDWDIRTTLETNLVEKGAALLPGLDTLSEVMALSKAAEVWRLSIDFKR